MTTSFPRVTSGLCLSAREKGGTREEAGTSTSLKRRMQCPVPTQLEVAALGDDGETFDKEIGKDEALVIRSDII